MPRDRLAHDDFRQRRALQRQEAEGSVSTNAPLTIDPSNGAISLIIGFGLTIVSGALQILLRPFPALILDSLGLGVLVRSAGGLDIDGAGLGIKLDPDPSNNASLSTDGLLVTGAGDSWLDWAGL